MTETTRSDSLRSVPTTGSSVSATGSSVPTTGSSVSATGSSVSATGSVSAYGYVANNDKEALVRRMRRIEGQARGIEKMITEDRYCIDILTQISAVSTALQTVAGILLDDHVNHCVRHALGSGDEAVATEKTTELLQAVHRYARTR